MKTHDYTLFLSTTLKFEAITRRTLPLLNSYFSRYPSRSCDFSIAGVMMWVDYYGYEVAEVKHTLFIRGIDPESGVMLYYKPLGEMPEEEWRQLIAESIQQGTTAKLLLPLECDAETQESLTGSVSTESALMEYLYPIERFVGFAGKKMEKKRNHLNYFLKNYSDAVIEPVNERNIDELIAFTEDFANMHEDSTLALYENNKTIEALSDFASYPFIGIAIRLNGKIIGYSFGEKSGDTFFVHVEKGDISYRGIYQALASNMSKVVNTAYPEVRYLNREEDMGNESLRKSKESYHPTLFVNKRIENISAIYPQTLLRIA